MSHTKLHWLWQRLGELNDSLVPGRGRAVGLNPKKDFITPLDFVPFIGPANKLNKGRKLLVNSRKLKYFVVGGGGLILDLLGLKEGYEYLTRRKGSGAPLASSPTAPKKAISRSANDRRACPRGMRWDGKKGKCVRLRRR